MKKFWIISVVAAIAVTVISCNKPRRNPGRVYMPDMAYSRAYETYASTEALREKYKGITYSAMPVAGTFAKGDMLWVYPYKNDSVGYVQSASVKSPIPDSVKTDLVEAERLYLINCGICHGAKLDGNGPLYNDGNGPYPNAPKNLVSDDLKKMADGTMYHSITFGKGNMGSYASQLNTTQRWEVIRYIRSKQGGGSTMDTAMAKTNAVDTAKKK